MIWPNAASTPALKQKWCNETRSLEPRQTEDVNNYVQASAMMIDAQTVPAFGNLKAWFTRGGEHHESRQTIMCYRSNVHEGCKCDAISCALAERANETSETDISQRMDWHGTARSRVNQKTDEARTQATSIVTFPSCEPRRGVCTLYDRQTVGSLSLT